MKLSRIGELQRLVQHEKAKLAQNENLADIAAEHFELTIVERLEYLKAIQPTIPKRGAITIAAAFQYA